MGSGVTCHVLGAAHTWCLGTSAWALGQNAKFKMQNSKCKIQAWVIEEEDYISVQ